MVTKKNSEEKDKSAVKKSKTHNQTVGLKGENAAVRFLENKGIEVIDRN